MLRFTYVMQKFWSSEWSVAASNIFFRIVCYLTASRFSLVTTTDSGSQNICSRFSSIAGSCSLGKVTQCLPLYSPVAWARSGFLLGAFCQCNPHLSSEASAPGRRMQTHCSDIYFPSTISANQILITLVQITATSVIVNSFKIAIILKRAAMLLY